MAHPTPHIAVRRALDDLNDAVAHAPVDAPPADALASESERGPDAPIFPTTLPDGRPFLIAIDADCPRCGKPERAYDPARAVFLCSSMGGGPCGYESTERNR